MTMGQDGRTWERSQLAEIIRKHYRRAHEWTAEEVAGVVEGRFDRPSTEELEDAESGARQHGDLPGIVVLTLVAEVRRLRSLIRRVYPLVDEGRGQHDELNAELEREILAQRGDAKQ